LNSILNVVTFLTINYIISFFLQYLVSSKEYKLEFLLNIPFGSKLQPSIKLLKVSSRNILIYLFVLCLLLIFSLGSSYFTYVLISNFDQVINSIINSK